MGLSVTPVVSNILTTLVATVMTIMAFLSGIEGQRGEANGTGQVPTLSSRWGVNPVPMAILIFGILVGTSIGVFARSHNWLGWSEDISEEVKTWTDQGLKQSDVAQRLFDAKYPVGGTTIASNLTKDSKEGVLFSNSKTECNNLLSYPSAELPRYIKGTAFEKLSTLIEDAEKLRQVLEVVCTKPGP